MTLAGWLTGALLATAAPLAVAMDRNDSFQVNGETRSYYLHVPDGAAPAQGYPLILAFHGGGMQGVGMARVSGLNLLADVKGFIVAYPNGLDGHWNDGRISLKHPHNDLAFVDHLLDRLARTYLLAPGRLFATGLSNGALFVERLGCERAERFAGIAAIAGTLPQDVVVACKPAQPLAVLQIDGTADPIMPYGGGTVADFGGRGEGGKVTSVTNTVAFWAGRNGCDTALIESVQAPLTPLDPTRVKPTRYTGCPTAALVMLLTINGAGHVWPGGAQPVRPAITGRPSQQLDASARLVDFFLALPPR